MAVFSPFDIIGVATYPSRRIFRLKRTFELGEVEGVVHFSPAV
jgi:hypothetical protein